MKKKVPAAAKMTPPPTEAELRDQYRKVIRRTIREIGRIQKSV